MPRIDLRVLEQLTEREQNIVSRIVGPDGYLCQTCPAYPQREMFVDDRGIFFDFACEEDRRQAVAYYLWRYIMSEVRQEPGYKLPPNAGDPSKNMGLLGILLVEACDDE